MIKPNDAWLKNLEDINQENPHKKQHGNRAKQHMTDIVLAILIAVSQRMVGDCTRY